MCPNYIIILNSIQQKHFSIYTILYNKLRDRINGLFLKYLYLSLLGSSFSLERLELIVPKVNSRGSNLFYSNLFNTNLLYYRAFINCMLKKAL